MDDKEKVQLIRSRGVFVYALYADAHILNHLFGYKVNHNRKAGFPGCALNKVLNV